MREVRLSSDRAEALDSRYAGQRVLLLEDEFLVAMMIEEMLAELGFTIIDIATTLEEAIAAVRAKPYDIAVLDVNINGRTSFPVADILLDTRTPFLFSTGYSASGVLSAYAHVPALQKPFQRAQLAKMVSGVLRGRS